MAERIIDLIQNHGYPAIAALMFLENIFPPVPSELIMPFAGFVAARGELSPILVLLSGTLGSLAGTLPWYFAGKAVGLERLQRWTDRHGRWMAVSKADLTSAQRWFERRGALAVTLGRLVPALRSVISAPAGIASMPFKRFLWWSSLGTLIWNGVLVAAGFLLESRYEDIITWLNPVSKAVIAGALAAYLWRVIRFKRPSASTP